MKDNCERSIGHVPTCFYLEPIAWEYGGATVRLRGSAVGDGRGNSPLRANDFYSKTQISKMKKLK